MRAVGRLEKTNRLALAIALPLRNQDALEELLRNLYDPASPAFRHYLTPDQFAGRFGPTAKDYESLAAHAQSRGLTVIGRHGNRTLLDVSGTVAQIEAMFQVSLRTYQHPTEARTFFAPDVEPSLDLAVPVLSVSGLDDFVVPRPCGLHTNFFRSRANATALATGSGPIGNFIGRDFRNAYLPGVSLDGSGQSVGLFEMAGYNPSDVTDYQNLAGEPNLVVTNVLIDGFAGLPGIEQPEVVLDIDMAGAMAPGLASIIVYEGINGNDVLNRMATDNLARQLSSSWNFGQPVDPAREQILQQFAAQGQSFFQASGDLGALRGRRSAVGRHFRDGGGWDRAHHQQWNMGFGNHLAGKFRRSQPFVFDSELAATVGDGGERRFLRISRIPDVACLADDVIWLIVYNGQEGVVGDERGGAAVGGIYGVDQPAGGGGRGAGAGVSKPGDLYHWARGRLCGGIP